MTMIRSLSFNPDDFKALKIRFFQVAKCNYFKVNPYYYFFLFFCLTFIRISINIVLLAK